MNPVTEEGIENKRYPVSIGYIIIPADVDRTKYISQCYRKGVVSVQFENGSHMLDIPITIETLKEIDFPEVGSLGSCVICATEYSHNKPIVIGKLLKDDEANTFDENQFKLNKRTNNGEVSIVGSGKNGNLFIDVTGRIENGGQIFVNVYAPDKKGKVNLNIKGDLNIELENVSISALNSFRLKTKNNVNVDSTEGVINLGDDEKELEASLLGDKTIEQLSKEVQALTDLIQSIANIIPVNVVSGSPDATWGTWKSAVAAITDRGDFSAVQSEKTFIE